jgi:2-hydroxychromene-2-carboxylate isomerase
MQLNWRHGDGARSVVRRTSQQIAAVTLVDFYFDFVSPYAYLAWRRASSLAQQIVLVPRPIMLGPVLTHHGQLAPAEIPAKRSFMIRDTLRRAAEAGIQMTWPQWHPFKPARALKAVLAVEPTLQMRVIDALFRAAWERGEDLEQDAVIAAALDADGLAGASIVERIAAPELSVALRAEVERALERGVFGVPTFVDVDGELFFGDDQLPRLAQKRAGHDPLDAKGQEEAKKIDLRPVGVRRRRT